MGPQSAAADVMKNRQSTKKLCSTSMSVAESHDLSSAARPFVCPYEGCGKDYIHKYKLNLHLKNHHADHNSTEISRCYPAVDEASNQDVSIAKAGVAKNLNRNKPNLVQEMPPAKRALRRISPPPPANMIDIKKLQRRQEYSYEDDSEGTEDVERYEIVECSSRHRQETSDDEDTEDEE